MEVIVNHDRFFTRLVNMIPSDLYNHTESMTGNKNVKAVDVIANSVIQNAEIEETSGKYFKHKKQPLAADEKKLLRQERKKRKYEPDQDEVRFKRGSFKLLNIFFYSIIFNSFQVEEDILPSSTGTADAVDEKGDISHEPLQHVFNKDAPSTNLDELRKRLQDRISQMREQRKAKKPRIEDAKKLKNKKLDAPSVASSVGTGSEILTKPNEKKGFSATDALSRAEALQQELLVSNVPSSMNLDSSDLEFNPISQTEADISEQIRQATKKREGGKVARLQRLLKEAEQKRERLTTLMASKDETQQAKARAEQWNDVLTVAAGGKALLVSTIGHNVGHETTRAEQRIKKALKKREKKKEKSAKEWNERLRNVDDEQKARLDKREENIKLKKQRHLGKTSKEDAAEVTGRKGSGRFNESISQGKPSDSNNSKPISGNHRAGFEGKKSSGKFLNK